jgi:hypothetical protein
VRGQPKTPNGVMSEARDKADSILERLADIRDAAQAALAREQYKYVKLVGVVPAGQSLIDLSATPLVGAYWMVERIVVSGDGGAPSAVLIYLGEAGIPQNLVDGVGLNAIAPLSGNGFLDPGDRIYVPPGVPLIVRFIGQTPGRECTVNLRVKEMTIGNE